MYFTCQFASVFPCNHNNPVPLNCDRCGSAGQIGNICYRDNQDIAHRLEKWGEKLQGEKSDEGRSSLLPCTRRKDTFTFESCILLLFFRQDQVYFTVPKSKRSLVSPATLFYLLVLAHSSV